MKVLMTCTKISSREGSGRGGALEMISFCFDYVIHEGKFKVISWGYG